MDFLHEKIRKLKAPLAVDFGIKPELLPPFLTEEEGNFPKAYGRFCRELLKVCKGQVPAVRFAFDAFALLGGEGLDTLAELLQEARRMGFYVLLDSTAIQTPWDADRAAAAFFGPDSPYPCDGLIISPYIGSDAVKPFLDGCKDGKKDLFLTVRSPNKSASELQDLMTGSRLVQGAAADLAKRFGETMVGKCGYCAVGIGTSAGSPGSLRSLRTTYPRLYQLVDGVDYPSGNAKNCSYAFDRFGYGAVVSAGPCITGAWKEAGTDGWDYTAQAAQAIERMKRNLLRYIAVL